MNSSKAYKQKSRDIVRSMGRAQHRRHVLVFVAQMLFALNLLVVYITAASVSDAGLEKTPRLLLFLVYVAQAFYYLWRSRTAELSPLSLSLSTALDFALLFEVMLLQSMAGSFPENLLSAPLFSYVYLFIAVRCLHFHASLVLLAGALAVASWLAQMGIVMALSSWELYGILESGSIDRVLSILAVTAVLSLCMREARHYFKSSVVRAVTGAGLTRLVNETVAQEVLFSDGSWNSGQGRKQTVAIIMMDIRNFTNLAFSSDPSEVMALLKEYQAVMEPIIIKHGGLIDKFMGDGILAHFGAINNQPRFAAAALRCVEHLVHTTEKWNLERVEQGRVALSFAISCAAGEAVVGLVGGNSKLEFTIIGNPVNIAAKLEKHTKVVNARALTTLATFEMAKIQGYSPVYPGRRLRSVKIGGLDHALDLVVLGDPKASAAPHSQPAPAVMAS